MEGWWLVGGRLGIGLASVGDGFGVLCWLVGRWESIGVGWWSVGGWLVVDWGFGWGSVGGRLQVGLDSVQMPADAGISS